MSSRPPASRRRRRASSVATGDLVELVGLLGHHRLVTLTGTGGIGKTRLAMEVVAALGAESEDRYPDGMSFVDLVPVRAADSLGDAVASALGIVLQSGPSAVDALVAALLVRRALIVFDNCEHVLAAAADLVEAIVARAPSVTIIATSREALRVPEERVWAVPSLGIDRGVRLLPRSSTLRRTGQVVCSQGSREPGRRRPTRSSTSADVSTASRWRSSWPRRAWGR